MNQKTILSGQASFGVDVGHSAVKIAVAMLDSADVHEFAVIPTVVIPAFAIPHEDTARQAALDTVTIEGGSYFFGRTAILQGNASVFSGQERNWITSKNHDVLIVAAWQRAMGLIGRAPKKITLVLGLPMAFFSAQKNALRERARHLLERHLAPGQQLDILVQAQSMVPLKNLQHLKNGMLNKQYNMTREAWGVIDIGHYTTDFGLLLQTQIRNVGSDSIAGASLVYSAVAAEFNARGYLSNLRFIDKAVTTGQVRLDGADLDVSGIVDVAAQPLRDLIIDRTQTLFGDVARELDGIIVSGGAAPLVFEAIKRAFPLAVLDAHGGMSIAEGLCRFGLFTHRVNSGAVPG